MFNFKYFIASKRAEFFFSDFSHALEKTGKAFPPLYVLWDCTRRCNLNCAHCGASKETYPVELTATQIKKLVDELAEMKVRFFAATGGEPLMRKDLLEILSYAKRKGINTGFATNGFFITEKTADEIQLAGIGSVQVSLDGLENTHNKIRGNPESFSRALNAIKLLKERKIRIVSVATTVSPLNLNELPDLLELLKETGVRLWRLGIIMPIGRSKSGELILRSGQLRELLKFVEEHNSKEMEIKIGENLPFLGEFEKKIRKAPLVCPVGFTACCIGVDGHVRGCPEEPDTAKFREGSILEKPFKEIWNSEFKRYRQRTVLKEDPECSKCRDKNSCYRI